MQRRRRRRRPRKRMRKERMKNKRKKNGKAREDGEEYEQRKRRKKENAKKKKKKRKRKRIRMRRRRRRKRRRRRRKMRAKNKQDENEEEERVCKTGACMDASSCADTTPPKVLVDTHTHTYKHIRTHRKARKCICIVCMSTPNCDSLCECVPSVCCAVCQCGSTTIGHMAPHHHQRNSKHE